MSKKDQSPMVPKGEEEEKEEEKRRKKGEKTDNVMNDE